MSRKALLLFLAAGFAWGIPYLFIRIAVEDFSTYSIVLFRVLIGALVLVPIALKQGALLLALKHWPWVLGFALLEMAGPWWLITESGRHLSSGLIGLLIATVPFFAVVIASFLGDKSVFHPKTIMGLLLGFSGVVALVGIDSFSGHIDPLWVGAVILAAAGYAIAPAMISQKIGFVPTAGVISLSMVIVAAIYAVPAAIALPAEIAAGPCYGVLDCASNSWCCVLGNRVHHFLCTDQGGWICQGNTDYLPKHLGCSSSWCCVFERTNHNWIVDWLSPNPGWKLVRRETP